MKSLNKILFCKNVSISIKRPSYFSCFKSWRHVKTKNLPNSNSTENRCSLEFSNDSSKEKCYILCWVSDKSKLFHYYRISQGQTHIENTFIGHVFVIFKDQQNVDMKFKYLYDIPSSKLIGIIKLNKHSGNTKHIVRLDDSECINYQSLQLDFKSIIDNSNKIYLDEYLGGWKVKYEPGVFEKYKEEGLQVLLEEDLKAAAMKLPQAACKYLQASVIIWLNDTITYGPAPGIVGSTCCYHESADWLKDNGLTVEKEGCIEVYSASNYLKSRQRWGVGGLMLHELSHAYHSRCVTDGFNNSLLHDVYEIAMRTKLYDKVSRKLTEQLEDDAEDENEDENDSDEKPMVMKKKKKKKKSTEMVISKSPPDYQHYACTNVMEFFAELSTAYHCNDADVDFNSWWPYNRSQLKNHDARTFQVLEGLWKNPNIQTIDISVA